MNRKGFLFLGEQVVKIIMSVISIVILIGIAVGLFVFFAPDNELAKAETDLNGLINQINIMSSSSSSYTFTTAINWYLCSSEYNDVCTGNEGRFCLCISKEPDCGSERKVCKGTSEFVFINPEGERTMLIDPKSLKIELKRTGYTSDAFYVVRQSDYKSPTLFLRFNSQSNTWEGSYNPEKILYPLDQMNDDKIYREDKYILQELQQYKNSQERGNLLLSNIPAKKANEIIRITKAT